MSLQRTLDEILARLDDEHDYSGWHWQPGTDPHYICISAILVQHTAWSNVEHALSGLRDADALTLDAVLKLSEDELADLVRPSGTPWVKAKRLHAMAQLADDNGGLEGLLELPTDELRGKLLETEGIGPETADVILLYAADRPSFVIDGYAQRIFHRYGIGPEGDDYDDWQHWFHEALPEDAGVYRQYHALLVLHGKTACRPRPRCYECCLQDICETGQQQADRPTRQPYRSGQQDRPGWQPENR